MKSNALIRQAAAATAICQAQQPCGDALGGRRCGMSVGDGGSCGASPGGLCTDSSLGRRAVAAGCGRPLTLLLPVAACRPGVRIAFPSRPARIAPV